MDINKLPFSLSLPNYIINMYSHILYIDVYACVLYDIFITDIYVNIFNIILIF